LDIFAQILNDPSAPTIQVTLARNELAVTLLGLGQVDEAVDLLRNSPTRVTSVREAFNYAMALWAQQGTPDSSSFELVIQLDKDNGTANYAQCLAVALAVVGQAEGAEERLNQARSRLTSRPEPAFSCWQSPLSDGIPNASDAWSICVSAA
jgi:thioredoxin-like negative regulator of GroEL